MYRVLIFLSVTAAFALSGCGASHTSSTATASPGGSSAPAAAQTAPQTVAVRHTSARALRIAVQTRHSAYGTILVDGSGRTLYLFTHDAKGLSRCDGPCATAWPPYMSESKLNAAGAARGTLLGSARRSDGRRQVSYRGHPLYYYVGDSHPGDILCQDVEEYGGHWWVVSPTGDAVTGAGPPCKRTGA